MSDEELKKQFKENKIGISMSYGLLGKVGKEGANIKGSASEGVARRLRKENARILTVLKERRK